jgi:hypothetical protein
LADSAALERASVKEDIEAFVRFIWEFDGIMRLLLSTQIKVGIICTPTRMEVADGNRGINHFAK